MAGEKNIMVYGLFWTFRGLNMTPVSKRLAKKKKKNFAHDKQGSENEGRA